MKLRHYAGFFMSDECPKVADSRSLTRAYERLLTIKLPLKLDESATIEDPKQTLVAH
jgi:hypothetical protein